MKVVSAVHDVFQSRPPRARQNTRVGSSMSHIKVWVRSMVDLEAYPTPIISMYRTQAQLDVVDMTQA